MSMVKMLDFDTDGDVEKEYLVPVEAIKKQLGTNSDKEVETFLMEEYTSEDTRTILDLCMRHNIPFEEVSEENTRIIYTSAYGEKYTEDDFMACIDRWLENNSNLFSHLTLSKYEQLRQETFNMVYSIVEWQSPETVVLELDENDIEALLSKVE